MLRITCVEHADDGPIIKLEGKLLSPWVGEVQQAWKALNTAVRHPRLDLGAVSYVDAAGIALLRLLLDRKATIVACSGYVAELLHGSHSMTRSASIPCHCNTSRAEVEVSEDFGTDLLAAMRAGQPDAYEAFVRQHGPYLLAVARRFLRCEQDIADAVQDAFISAFQAIDQFSGNSHVRTWLHRIVVNACLMKLRGSARHPVISMEAFYPRFDGTGHQISLATAWVENPLDRLVNAEVRRQVRERIDLLPDDFRTVLLLRDIDELDTRQTAEVLGVSTAVIKTRLHRARQALRTLLEPIFSL